MRIQIRDPESFGPGSGMEKFGSGIWDKHPGSATLEKTAAKLNQGLRIPAVKSRYEW
jgi:hypothetical protein